MKKSDLKIIKLDVAGVKKMLFCVPVKINDSWQWYDSHKAYCKAAMSQTEALKIRDQEVLPICEDK